MADTMHVNTEPSSFKDRRQSSDRSPVGVERRQFGNSYRELSEEARELALAIDSYKVAHRRRYVTYEEMLQVVKSLGYHRE